MKVFIDELKFKAIIGILSFERKKKQKLIINLSFNYDYSKSSFIDYNQIRLLVKKNIQKQKFYLLEDAILDTKNLLYNKFKIKKLNIKISKPNIIKKCVVSISN